MWPHLEGQKEEQLDTVTLHLHTVYKMVSERTREEIMESVHRIAVSEIEGALQRIGSGLIL